MRGCAKICDSCFLVGGFLLCNFATNKKPSFFYPKITMAKKSAIKGEYIITQEDSGTIRVCKIYDNVKGALREMAESKNFEYDNNWTTQQFGKRVIDAFGANDIAYVGEYVVTRTGSGHIDIYRTYDNTLGALREVAESIGFAYDKGWTTRQFGSKLIDALNA